MQALAGLEGIKKVIASFQEKNATVVHDPASVTVDQIREAFLKAGYVASIGEATEQPILKPVLEEKIEFKDNELVCYCFKYTKNDIEQDFIKNGSSTILVKIAAEKKSGGCDCASKNPKGITDLYKTKKIPELNFEFLQ